MSPLNSRQIEGKQVMSNDGFAIGEVQGFFLNTAHWNVEGFEVKLLRGILERLGMHKPILGSTSVRVPVDWISGVGDNVVLKFPVDGIKFSKDE